jgi:hypothetical protein
MSKEQDEEIKTIKERNVRINLSDADIERLYNKTGEVGLTVSELLENFIGDLVGGTYSNGSDERMYANQWFDRCGFSMDFGDMSFLQWLIINGSIEEVVDEWSDFQMFKEDEEIDENDKKDIAIIEADMDDFFSEYRQQKRSIKNCTLETEMKKVMQWHEEKIKLKSETIQSQI